MAKKSYSFCHIGLIQEGPPVYQPPIKNAKDVASFFQKRFGRSPQEHFAAIYLNTRNRPIGWREISRGTLNANLVHPRETFLPAVKLSAAALIVIHNHPSHEATPSPEDIEVTRRLSRAGNILGIELLDHLIVTPTDYVSIRDWGWPTTE